MKRNKKHPQQMNIQAFNEQWNQYQLELTTLETLCKKTSESFSINKPLLYDDCSKKPSKNLFLDTITSHNKLLQELGCHKENLQGLLKQLEAYSSTAEKTTASSLRKIIGNRYKFVRLNEIICHYYLSSDYIFYRLHHPALHTNSLVRKKKDEEALLSAYEHLLSSWEKILAAQKDIYSEDFSNETHLKLLNEIAENHHTLMLSGVLYNHQTLDSIQTQGALLTYYQKTFKMKNYEYNTFGRVFITTYVNYLENNPDFDQLWQETSVLAVFFHHITAGETDFSRNEIIYIIQKLEQHYSSLFQFIKQTQQKIAMYWLELTAFIQTSIQLYSPQWETASRRQLLTTLLRLIQHIAASQEGAKLSFKFDLKQWKSKLLKHTKTEFLIDDFSVSIDQYFLEKQAAFLSASPLQEEIVLPTLSKLPNDINSDATIYYRNLATLCNQKITQLFTKVKNFKSIQADLEKKFQQQFPNYSFPISWEDHDMSKAISLACHEENKQLLEYQTQVVHLVEKMLSPVQDDPLNRTLYLDNLDYFNHKLNNLQNLLEGFKQAESLEEFDKLTLFAEQIAFNDLEELENFFQKSAGPVPVDISNQLLIGKQKLDRYKQEIVRIKSIEVQTYLTSSKHETIQKAPTIQNNLYFFIQKNIHFFDNEYINNIEKLIIVNDIKLLPYFIQRFSLINKKLLKNVYEIAFLDDLQTWIQKCEAVRSRMTNVQQDQHQWAEALALLDWLVQLYNSPVLENKKEEIYYCFATIISHFEHITYKLLKPVTKESCALRFDINLVLELLFAINNKLSHGYLDIQIYEKTLNMKKRAIKLGIKIMDGFHSNLLTTVITEADREVKQLQVNEKADRLKEEIQTFEQQLFEKYYLAAFQQLLDEEEKNQTSLFDKKQNFFSPRYEDENSDDELELDEHDEDELMLPQPEVVTHLKGLRKLQYHLEKAEDEENEFAIAYSHYDLSNYYFCSSMRNSHKIEKQDVALALESMDKTRNHLNAALDKTNHLLALQVSDDEDLEMLKGFVGNLEIKLTNWTNKLHLLSKKLNISRDKAKADLIAIFGPNAWTKFNPEKPSVFTRYRQSIQKMTNLIEENQKPKKQTINRERIQACSHPLLRAEESSVGTPIFLKKPRDKSPEKTAPKRGNPQFFQERFIQQPADNPLGELISYNRHQRARSWDNAVHSISFMTWKEENVFGSLHHAQDLQETCPIQPLSPGKIET